MTGIAELSGIYLGALVLTFALEFLQTYLMQWTGQKVMFDLRSEIFRASAAHAATASLIAIRWASW